MEEKYTLLYFFLEKKWYIFKKNCLSKTKLIVEIMESIFRRKSEQIRKAFFYMDKI